ncbi:MAG: ATP-binding protein [Nostocales cyanobacterium]|nr:MAG: ATP-binding protein [Nostocales cyanobacterium]
MQSIDDIILRNINPFDNFYCPEFINHNLEEQSTISYLHQETFIKIETLLSQNLQDHITRTALITGDSSCGKTYLLNSLKIKLNYKSFFVKIPPFAKRDSIWRRILRYTVDSLVKPKNEKITSPLLLYLSKIKEEKDKLLNFFKSDKQNFISKMKEKYKKVKIHNADDFFSILYELTTPELYELAIRYLRGDDLAAESLKSLGVEKSINTETTARETLTNLSIITCEIQPIIICFYHLESLPKLPNGRLDLDALFQINAKIREDNQNIVIIFSINSHRWQEYQEDIQKLYPESIDQEIELKDVSLAQAELMLGSRLESLHKQAKSLPSSPLYPLNRQFLERSFPIGRMNFRDVSIYGKSVFNAYKKWLLRDEQKTDFNLHKNIQDKLDITYYFKVRWYEEFSQIQQQISKIHKLSSTELIQILQDVLLLFGIKEVATSLFIRSKYASYSLSYQLPNTEQNIGIVWTEDENSESFFYAMEACRKTLEKNPSLKLILIRSQDLSSSQSRGYQVYQDIFLKPQHRYIIPSLDSVHYLATYHSLVKTAREGDLVVGSKVISLRNLQSLIAATRILDDCDLLQDLGIVKNPVNIDDKNYDSRGEMNVFKPIKKHIDVKNAKDYIFNLVITQSCLSRQVLLQKAVSVFSHLSELQLDNLIQQLCWENKIKIIDPKAHPSVQLVVLFPGK